MYSPPAGSLETYHQTREGRVLGPAFVDWEEVWYPIGEVRVLDPGPEALVAGVAAPGLDSVAVDLLLSLDWVRWCLCFVALYGKVSVRTGHISSWYPVARKIQSRWQGWFQDSIVTRWMMSSGQEDRRVEEDETVHRRRQFG